MFGCNFRKSSPILKFIFAFVIRTKFQTKPMQIFPPHLDRTATLPCETWMIEIATDFDENVYINCSSAA